MTGDASALYNAGTTALAQGRIGESVAFLVAARRLDPRAADAARNLAIAEAHVAAGRGEEIVPLRTTPPSPTLSTGETWWLAAALLAVAAVARAARAVRAARTQGAPIPPRAWTRAVAIVPAAAGALLAAWLTIAALDERAHPEAVVVVPLLEARRGPDEPQRPPVLLRAGERVRLGRGTGADVEVRLGGTPIGWAAREGLWRVSDAPRYTRQFGSR